MQGTLVPFRIAMSGKNFRVAQTGQRTNAEGKQVSNKVLLATPDKKTSWSPNSTVPIATPAEKTP